MWLVCTKLGLKGGESYVEGNFYVVGGEDSHGLLHVDDAMQDDSDDGVVSSQPMPPYVGMVFDTLEDSQKFYNDYAFKLWFGTHISSSKFNQKRHNIKRQAAGYYTRNVFGKFHTQLTMSTDFIIKKDPEYQGQGL
ncbi:Cell division control 48-E-like protein [Hordeum vulgare]|nr:Cell division control 48-E-like protein [Hordeum vulgare]